MLAAADPLNTAFVAAADPLNTALLAAADPLSTALAALLVAKFCAAVCAALLAVVAKFSAAVCAAAAAAADAVATESFVAALPPTMLISPAIVREPPSHFK